MTPGTKLGHYEILSLLGKGGMGEVWRARDTKLGREVAIKTLPEEFAKDADRLARFEREAKLLASLNHPNIAAIYGFEQHNGTHFLVLELVEGDTLADRLKRGAIPVEESLKLALQMAEALEAAHEKGVIHRDFKPANIKVTPSGKVKVLDFGLAKAFAGNEASANPADSPTLSIQATQQGMILGTAPYMSPEQAAGRATDKRTDIWAFGAVLYEMLSGRAAFVGDDVSDILATVLKTDPDWNGLPANLNPRLQEILERSLEKDLNGRYHDVADMGLDIQRLLAHPGGLTVSVAEAVHAAPQSKLPWIAVFVLGLVIAGGAVWIVRAPGTPESASVSRFYYDLPEGLFIQTLNGRSSVAISTDGNRFVYKGIGGDSTGLYIRSMNELEARLIPGTETAENPVFSPDGREIAYYQGTPTGRLMKVAVGGGARVVLADSVENPFGMSWERDGSILYGQRDGIWQVSENGSAPVRVVSTEPGEQAHGPQLLPGGEWVLFSLARTVGATRWDDADIVIESLASADRRVLWQGGSDARYVPTGHLVYASGDALFALPFDADRLEPTGRPTSILQGVRRAAEAQTGEASYSISGDGTLVYVFGGPDSGSTLVTVDRNGNPQAFTDEARNYTRPRVSPDGSRVAVEVTETSGDSPVTHVWTLNVDTGNGAQLTFEGSQNQFPVWTRDSQAVVFRSDRSGSLALYTKAADGSGRAELVFEGTDTLVATDVLPDGTLLLQDSRDGDNEDIWTLPPDGDGSAREFLATPNVERSARFSPDGGWIAYISDESGQFEVYVRPYPNTGGGQRRVSEGGAGSYAPVWSPDGRELYYDVGPPEVLMSVSIQTDPSLQLGRPQELFPIEEIFQANVATVIAPLWDVTSDGSGFVFVQPAAQGEFTDENDDRVYVVLDWFEELRARAPVP